MTRKRPKKRPTNWKRSWLVTSIPQKETKLGPMHQKTRQHWTVTLAGPVAGDRGEDSSPDPADVEQGAPTPSCQHHAVTNASVVTTKYESKTIFRSPLIYIYRLNRAQ